MFSAELTDFGTDCLKPIKVNLDNFCKTIVMKLCLVKSPCNCVSLSSAWKLHNQHRV